MQYLNNNLAIEASWLVEEEIVSESNYKQLVLRNHLQVVRRGCLNTPALVDFESMPDRFKRAIEMKLGGSPYDKVKTNQLQVRIEASAAASNYFDTYKLNDGRYLPTDTRREYYTNAIVLDAIHKMINDKKAKRSALGGNTKLAWEQITDAALELDRTKYPHTLPGNARRMEDKYKKYISGGLQSLIHKNFLNSNAAKVDDDVKESLMLELIASPNNLDNAQIVGLYNLMAERMKWKKITAGTVAVWRDKMEMVSYAGRRGSVAFSNKKAMQVKRSAPTCPLYFWTMDGWDVELMFQQTETNKAGHSVTTYHQRPTVVVVLDACCKYPIGYAIGTHENPELIKQALRSAAHHTSELFGTMMRTHQIQSDRYAIKSLTPFYETMGDKFTPARAKNAKAKIIEPYFNTINKKYCQLQANWSGFGITSDRDKQPNVEYLNKFKKNFPDFEGVCAQVTEIIEKERAEKREKYLQLWENTPEADKIELTHENYLLHFGESTGRRVLLQGSGLHPTIMGMRRAYDCFDITFREHAGVRWDVRYDPQDLSYVLAVSEDESLRYVLEEKYVQPMALKDRKEGDSDELQRIRNYNKQQAQHVIEARTKSALHIESLIDEVRAIDTLNKLLMTDSDGQHKNNRNAIRAKSKDQGTKMLEEAQVINDNDEFDIYKLY